MPLTLWTTPDRTRHFLVPDDAALPEGPLTLRTASGRDRTVDPEAVAPYEVSETEARAWLESQLRDVLDEAKAGVLGFVGRLRKKTAALREERRQSVDAFVAQARAAGRAEADPPASDGSPPTP